MVKRIDIYRSANILIKKYGDDAEDYAVEKMEKFLAADDVKASGFWLDVAHAIRDLERSKDKSKLH